MARTKRVLILMSDTGGGHRASAEALRTAFQELYGSALRVDIVDLWMKHTPWPLNQLPKTYRFLTNDAPWLWKLLWEVSDEPGATKPVMRAAYRLARRRVAQMIAQYAPDLIISTHPLLQEVPMKVLARMRRRVPFVTVVTDMATIHPTWFQKNVALCCVPNDRVYRMALDSGLRKDQLRQCGFPIRPVFAHEKRPKEEVRRVLGLHPDLSTVLLVGGGEGIGKVKEIAHTVTVRLAQDGAARGETVGQLAIICGRNHKLREELNAQAWPVPTVVNGFVTNMWEWMAASDCLITKAGPNTIAEALALGVPLLLNGFIAGQEEGNVPYIIEGGAGIYCEDPGEIAAIIGRWFGPEQHVLAAMAERARQIGCPDAAYRVAEKIAALLR